MDVVHAVCRFRFVCLRVALERARCPILCQRSWSEDPKHGPCLGFAGGRLPLDCPSDPSGWPHYPLVGVSLRFGRSSVYLRLGRGPRERTQY